MPNSPDDPFEVQERDSLAKALAEIPGGDTLLDWFGDLVDFGDSEIICLVLNREGPSQLVIALDRPGKSVAVTFELSHWIDINIRGFSHQNVVGALVLQRAAERDVDPWELGVGLQPGEWIIALAPCFGASGTIRANISRITLA